MSGGWPSKAKCRGVSQAYRDSRGLRLITRPAIRHALQVGSEAGMDLSEAPEPPATLRAPKRAVARA
jgi:hypothetical protein